MYQRSVAKLLARLWVCFIIGLSQFQSMDVSSCMPSYRSNSPTGHNLLWTAVMCCRHLLVGCISSKLEMQGIDLDFLQMGVVDYCAESCGFRYKHTSGSQCCRVRSNTEVLLFIGGLLVRLDSCCIAPGCFFVLQVSYCTACYQTQIWLVWPMS
jgi:hypothetical protein